MALDGELTVHTDDRTTDFGAFKVPAASTDGWLALGLPVRFANAGSSLAAYQVKN